MLLSLSSATPFTNPTELVPVKDTGSAIQAAKAAGIDPFGAVPSDYSSYVNGVYYFAAESKVAKWVHAQIEIDHTNATAAKSFEKRLVSDLFTLKSRTRYPRRLYGIPSDFALNMHNMSPCHLQPFDPFFPPSLTRLTPLHQSRPFPASPSGCLQETFAPVQAPGSSTLRTARTTTLLTTIIASPSCTVGFATTRDWILAG